MNNEELERLAQALRDELAWVNKQIRELEKENREMEAELARREA